MKLGDKLKLIRLHIGLTQDQMAEKLGLTSELKRARVSEWEVGRGEPKRSILIKYSEIANIEIKQLIDDREDLILS
jgi:transcriptional regulator with XRE-family HTH domain